MGRLRSSRRVRLLRLPSRRWPAVVLAVLVAVLAALHERHPEWFSWLKLPQARRAIDARECRVARVVDGDTLVLAEGNERVRLQGVDTPETVKPDWPVEPWGPEAARFTRGLLEGGGARLEFDAERRDKYGRLLAYVWVGDRMLNEELLRAGLARATLQYSFSPAMKERFRRAEDEARAARRGIWSVDDDGTTP